MRNGSIYKQMEPERGHGVKKGASPRSEASSQETGDYAGKSHAGVQSWYSMPLRVLGQGPFLNKNAQPASKSYLVLGEGQAPLGWVRADSFLLSHCLSETGSKSSLEEDTPLLYAPSVDPCAYPASAILTGSSSW